MKRRPIIVIEPICEGFEHSKFNALFVSSLALALEPEGEMEFWGETAHCLCVEKQLLKEVRHRVLFRPFGLPVGVQSRRVRFLVHLVTAVIRSIPSAKKTIFLSVNTPVLYATTAYRSLGLKRYVIHSYFPQFLELLGKWKSRRASSLFRKLVIARSAFVALRGDIIAAATEAWSEVKIDHVAHPIGKVRPRLPPADNKTVIGFLGRATPEKGFDVFDALAQKLRSPDVDFVHVGPAAPGSDSGAVTSESARVQLNDTDFAQALGRLSFVFYANTRERYRFIASGVVFDAIESSVPIVGLRDSFIEYLEATYSPIGLFYDRRDELEMAIKGLASSSLRSPAPASAKLLRACTFDSPAYLERIAQVLDLAVEPRQVVLGECGSADGRL